MCISSDNRVVVVHPGFRSDRKDPVCLVGGVAIAGGNIGGDLHAMDAGAGRDRGASAHRSSGHIVGIEYVCRAVGRIGSWTGKRNRISGPAQAIATIQYAIDFREIGRNGTCERIRLSNGSALQGTRAGPSGSNLQLDVNPVNRAAPIPVSYTHLT